MRTARAERRAALGRARKAAHHANMHAREMALENRRLRELIAVASAELDGTHYPDDTLPNWCATCSTADGSWPCVSKMVADELRDALGGGGDE